MIDAKDYTAASMLLSGQMRPNNKAWRMMKQNLLLIGKVSDQRWFHLMLRKATEMGSYEILGVEESSIQRVACS